MVRPLSEVQPLLAAELEALARNVGDLRREVRALPTSSGGSSAWGGITGTLSAQTDLNGALAGKQPLSAILTATTASFTTAQDGKLIGIATGATANATDADLRDRATHTGFQIISTVTGLQAALDGKQIAGSYAALVHGHIIADVAGLQAALDGKQVAGSYQPLATVLTNTTAAFTTAQETKLAGIAAGATANVGTVTSVSGTGTVSGLTLSGAVTASGNLTLGGTLVATAANFASQTAATFLAAPTGVAGVPTFRIIAAADVPTLNQSTTGSAATLTTGRTIAMTGDVAWTSASFNGSGNVTGTSTIGANVVTLAKMAQVTTATFLGRVTAATGNVESLTSTQATSLLDIFSPTLKGMAPLSGGGTTNFLRADGVWAAPTAVGGGVSDGDKGDITVSVAGTTWTIDAGAVTLAKQADVATGTVFYRKTALAGAPEVQTLATLKTDLGLTGTNSGDQTTVTGNAGSATILQTGRTISLTGDVAYTSPSFDGSGNITAAATIGAGVVSNAKLANMATATFKGRVTAATGVPEDLTGTQATSLLDVATGALKGVMSATDKTKLDGIAAGANTGTVTTVAVTTAAGVSGSVATPGTTPAITITLGAITPTSVAATGAITSSGAAVGYATGAGGAATQLTSKATAVTLAKPTGQITMINSALAAATSVAFTLTNSFITATDVVIVNIKSGAASTIAYQATVQAVAAGSCVIALRNVSAASLSEAVVLQYAVIKGVNA